MKTSKQPSISIGIPVYNEQENVFSLVQSLLAQKARGFSLAEIIVVSDGSTDQIEKRLRGVADSRVTLLLYKTRRGKSNRINEILKRSQSDLTLLIDADISLPHRNILRDVAKESQKHKYDLMSVVCHPFKAQSLFSHALSYSITMQQELIRLWNKGDNYLAFRGCFLVLSKSFASTFTMPNSVMNNDAYIYLYAKEHGLRTKYLQKVHVYYMLPKSLHDHSLQSARHRTGARELSQYFANADSYYAIPMKYSLSVACRYSIKNPVLFLYYLWVLLLTKFQPVIQSPLWEIASSTKQQIPSLL